MRIALSVVVTLAVVSASPLFAQSFGQITGIVTDTTGGVLPGATVSVTNTQTSATAAQQANTAGVYVFPNLLPGIYNVRVEMDGFRSAARNAVELQTQQTIRLDFKMEIGTLSETVTAVGTAPMLNTPPLRVATIPAAPLMRAGCMVRSTRDQVCARRATFSAPRT